MKKEYKDDIENLIKLHKKFGKDLNEVCFKITHNKKYDPTVKGLVHICIDNEFDSRLMIDMLVRNVGIIMKKKREEFLKGKKSGEAKNE